VVVVMGLRVGDGGLQLVGAGRRGQAVDERRDHLLVFFCGGVVAWCRGGVVGAVRAVVWVARWRGGAVARWRWGARFLGGLEVLSF
jgi:hypothetical protein